MVTPYLYPAMPHWLVLSIFITSGSVCAGIALHALWERCGSKRPVLFGNARVPLEEAFKQLYSSPQFADDRMVTQIMADSSNSFDRRGYLFDVLRRHIPVYGNNSLGDVLIETDERLDTIKLPNALSNPYQDKPKYTGVYVLRKDLHALLKQRPQSAN